MPKGDHKHRRKPKGATGGGYARPRVQIGFDKEVIEAVIARAEMNNRSFAAEIRALVALAFSSQASGIAASKNDGPPPAPERSAIHKSTG